MSQPYVGEIRLFGGTFAPAGWSFCNGALLSIAIIGLWAWPWFFPFVPDPSHRLMYSTLTAVLLVGFLRSALGTLNEFFVNTLGDVQIYTTHDENSAFYKFRKQIVETVEAIILQVLRASAGPLTTLPVPGKAAFASAAAPNGVMAPVRLRTCSRRTSAGRLRNLASACTSTCQVRPNRLKSLTYNEPR